MSQFLPQKKHIFKRQFFLIHPSQYFPLKQNFPFIDYYIQKKIIYSTREIFHKIVYPCMRENRKKKKLNKIQVGT